MNTAEWAEFLEGVIELQPEWSKQPGASESDLTALEEHLGTRLPPSYREFLKASNGFDTPNYHVQSFFGTEEIEWFSVANYKWADMYGGPDSGMEELVGDLFGMLQISFSQEAVILLNPAAINEDGDWQAVLFASWVPGVERFESLQEFLVTTFEVPIPNSSVTSNPCPMYLPANLDLAPHFWATNTREHYLEQIKSSNTRERKQAINALAFHHCDDDIEAIASCLSDEDESVQIIAAIFLTKFNSKLTYDSLAKAIQEGPIDLKLEAAESLLAMKQKLSAQSVTAIAPALQDTTDRAYTCSRILGKVDNVEAIEPLANAVRFWVTHSGYDGLNPVLTIQADLSLHGEQALNAIKGLLSDEHHLVRKHAVEALYRLSSEEATKLLKNATRDPHELVRERANKILKERKAPGFFDWLKKS